MNKYLIVIDNDECIGSWGDMSLLYSIIISGLNKVPDETMFADIIEKTCCIRPYVRKLYDTLLFLKSENKIHGIYMCTAASNCNGWVNFLAKTLEKWYGQRIYDGIICMEDIERWNISRNSLFLNKIGYIKDMNMIRELAGETESTCVIAIDDRPTNIINGTSIGVTPFHVAINLYKILELYFADEFNFLISKYESKINEGWYAYMGNPTFYTDVAFDYDIDKSITVIHELLFLYK